MKPDSSFSWNLGAHATAEADGQPLAAERLRHAVACVAGEVVATLEQVGPRGQGSWPRQPMEPEKAVFALNKQGLWFVDTMGFAD